MSIERHTGNTPPARDPDQGLDTKRSSSIMLFIPWGLPSNVSRSGDFPLPDMTAWKHLRKQLRTSLPADPGTIRPGVNAPYPCDTLHSGLSNAQSVVGPVIAMTGPFNPAKLNSPSATVGPLRLDNAQNYHSTTTSVGPTIKSIGDRTSPLMTATSSHCVATAGFHYAKDLNPPLIAGSGKSSEAGPYHNHHDATIGEQSNPMTVSPPISGYNLVNIADSSSRSSSNEANMATSSIQFSSQGGSFSAYPPATQVMDQPTARDVTYMPSRPASNAVSSTPSSLSGPSASSSSSSASERNEHPPANSTDNASVVAFFKAMDAGPHDQLFDVYNYVNKVSVPRSSGRSRACLTVMYSDTIQGDSAFFPTSCCRDSDSQLHRAFYRTSLPIIVYMSICRLSTTRTEAELHDEPWTQLVYR
ncbi:hypothetical protein C8Q74DRAFT_1215970 [Fomes fomentarius]|nr:hypothetical protein C8Q74DRAFT_1215970 [Fomes fomentarius]